MPAANVVKVLKQVATLTAEEKRELLALMSQPAVTNGASEQATENGIATETVSSYDHTPRLRWLKQYVVDYAGQYIAMDGDKLLAHGTDPEKVFAELQRLCPQVPYFGYIPATDESLTLGANLTL